MKKIRIDDFVRHYEPLYYNPDSCPDGYKWQYYGAKEGLEEKYKHLLKYYLNIDKLNATNYRAEEKVMKLLCSSTFNEISLAWKAGKVDWKNGQLITTDDFEKDDCLGGEQLAAFRLKPELQSCGMCYWLTDECSYSSKVFAIVNDYSKRDGIFVSSYSAVLAYGVRPFALLV